MKLEHLQAGDVVVLDDGYDCMPAGRATVQAADDGRLFVPCTEGRHFLEGQLREDGHLSGVFWPGQIEEQAAFRNRLGGQSVRLPLTLSAGEVGVIQDAAGGDLCTVDVNGALDDDETLAIAAWIAFAVNTCGGFKAEVASDG